MGQGCGLWRTTHGWPALHAAVASCLLSGPVFAQATAAPDMTAAAILNPLTNQTQLLISSTVAFPNAAGSEPESNTNFQPRVPIALSSDWRVVTRSNMAIVHTPAVQQRIALGDADMSFFGIGKMGCRPDGRTALRPGSMDEWCGREP